MRPSKACLQCRNGKRRCDRAGSSACTQCVQRNLQCSAAANRDRPARVAVQPLLPHQSRPDADALHLVDLYFRYYNDRPHSIFHEHTFRTSLVAGTISQTILLAMMGLSARYGELARQSISPHCQLSFSLGPEWKLTHYIRFSVDPEVRAKGPIYTTRAKKLLHEDFENICLENIQACILLGNICYDECHADVESLYFGKSFVHMNCKFRDSTYINRTQVWQLVWHNSFS